MKAPTKREAVFQLAACFHRNGYVRHQNEDRLDELGPQIYKKGYEVRLTAHSEEELAQIQAWLRQLGFTIPKPFTKGEHYRQPLYGRQQVERFLGLVGPKQPKPKISWG